MDRCFFFISPRRLRGNTIFSIENPAPLLRERSDSQTHFRYLASVAASGPGRLHAKRRPLPTYCLVIVIMSAMDLMFWRHHDFGQ